MQTAPLYIVKYAKESFLINIIYITFLCFVV